MTSRPSSLPGPDLRGDLLGGRYQLGELLGAGGTASVYAAADRRLRRQVAVKVVHPEHVRTPEQRRRIWQEAIVGARVQHPHVVPIIDLGEDEPVGGERRMYLVMPLVRGRTLRQRILDGALAWPEALALSEALLTGLAALHRAGAIHRDIKPENCILEQVDDDEHLRLVDFGLAKPLRAGLVSRPAMSLAGSVIGTLLYLSPEQARGEVIDERSDLYAVGVVLYELLTRRPPFVGSHLEVLNAHVGARPIAPSRAASAAGIPAEVDAAVMRALAKDPAERFATAEMFSRALADARRGSAAPAAEAEGSIPGTLAAQASLAAWSRFEYQRAHEEAIRASRDDERWSPLRLIMSCLPEDGV